MKLDERVDDLTLYEFLNQEDITCEMPKVQCDCAITHKAFNCAMTFLLCPDHTEWLKRALPVNDCLLCQRPAEECWRIVPV